MKIMIGCIILILASMVGQAQVQITGQIIDSADAAVYLYEPIDGFCNNRDITKPEYVVIKTVNGIFSKKIDIKSPCFVILQIGYQPVYLFVEPHDTISVFINTNNLTKKNIEEKLIIKGKNSEGHKLFNAFNFYPGEKFGIFENYLDSLKHNTSNGNDFPKLNLIEEAIAKQFYPFELLYKKGKISANFYHTAKDGICGILVSRISRYYLQKKVTASELKKILDYLKSIYNKFPVTQEMLKQGLYNSSIAYYHYLYLARKDFLAPNLEDSIVTINRNKYIVEKDFVMWLYAPKNIAQIFWAESLVGVTKMFPNEFGKKDKATFLALFPNSKMKEYLNPPYFDPVDSRPKIYDSSAYIFLQGDTVNTFSSLIQNYKGQNVFIDFWATWCIPCRMEFSDYNAKVDSFCNAYKIKRIYLAFEKAHDIKNLSKVLYSYDLKGYHLIPNKLLIKDILKIFYNGNDTYSIPHSVLINKNGEIVDYDTPRLSSYNELFLAMKTALKLE